MTSQVAACGKMNITGLVATLFYAKFNERVSTAAATADEPVSLRPRGGPVYL